MKNIIPDARSNCGWKRQIKESIPDDASNNCLWMLPMKDYPYQMMFKQLLIDERTE